MASTLKLIIEKGARSGETLEFNSRSRIRLGRVVRGNNLTVKDPGISSKHLSIEFDSNLGKWVITDLDSSNGTILNSSQLKPSSPYVIGDGDVIKVGELTLIRVLIVGIGEIGGKLPDLREEVRVRAGNVGIRKGITNRGNGDCLGNVSVTVENSVDLGEEIRDSMPKKVRVVEERNVEDVKGKVGRRMKTRMTRSLRKEVEEFVSLEMAVRRTRSAKIVEDVTVREAEEGSKVDREAGNVGVVERITETGGKVKSYLASEYQLPEESASGEIPEETGTEYHDDLEKMTVGEWFEYLEAYLPKQIYNVTYEIIDDMRKRAKQFDDFMLSNSNRKRNANCL